MVNNLNKHKKLEYLCCYWYQGQGEDIKTASPEYAGFVQPASAQQDEAPEEVRLTETDWM